MRIEGRRIHIAGSASQETSSDLLQYAHQLVEDLVDALARQGARFIVGVGKEPRIVEADLSSPSIIFDWTVLATIGARISDDTVRPSGPQGQLVMILATARTEQQIPPSRQDLWSTLRDEDAVWMQFLDPGWTSGAVRRIRQARLGDILITLSGGEGVEHLATLYAQAGKPVIPLDLDLGASSNDGSGGSTRLFQRAQSNPERFARFSEQSRGAALFAGITTHSGTRSVESVVAALLRLLDSLSPPSAFYVRLLNSKVQEYEAVDRHFRDVVDPVVREAGYEPLQMGQGPMEYSWLNQAIFDSLHHSQLVIVDLTGNRPNCFMELGYALGREQRVLLTAMADTESQFDTRMLDYCPWADDEAIEKRKQSFREYWQRNIDRPPLVQAREVL